MLVGLFLIAVLAIVVTIQRWKQANEAWGELSDRLGLFYSPPSLVTNSRRVEGTYKDRTIRIDVRLEGYGRSQQKYTRYRVQIDDRWPEVVEIESHQKGILSRSPGGYETGHQTFDESFEVQVGVVEEAAELLAHPEMLHELLNLNSHFHSVYIRDGYLWCEEFRLAQRALAMKQALDRMLYAADHMKDALDAVESDGDEGGDWEEEMLFPDLDEVVADGAEQAQEATGVAW